MDSSSRRSLELKLMGCKGLQAFNFFQKLKVFAVVSLTSDTPGDKHHHPLQQQQQRTKTDAEGDKDPEWNHEMRFDLDGVGREDCDHLYLHIDLRYEFFGDKSLGEVRVPLTDLVCDSTTGLGEHGENCGVARFVSYEVRTNEKKPNGVITFSYKTLKTVNPLHGVGGSATATATATATTTTTYGHIDGYTVVNPVDDDNHHHHSNHDQNTTAAAAGYSTVNHVNGDLLHQQQQQNQNQHQHHHHHHQSDHDHDQHLQSPYGRADQEFSYHYSAVESTAYGIHYPPLEPPPYLPTPAGEGYMTYSRFDHHQFQYPPPPPPPPFHPPPDLTRISSHPFPPPQPPPPELTRISSDPFPPPLHHHHHHHHAAHGAVYPPPSTGDLYEQSYGMPSIYYNGDGTPRY